MRKYILYVVIGKEVIASAYSSMLSARLAMEERFNSMVKENNQPDGLKGTLYNTKAVIENYHMSNAYLSIEPHDFPGKPDQELLAITDIEWDTQDWNILKDLPTCQIVESKTLLKRSETEETVSLDELRERMASGLENCYGCKCSFVMQ